MCVFEIDRERKRVRERRGSRQRDRVRKNVQLPLEMLSRFLPGPLVLYTSGFVENMLRNFSFKVFIHHRIILK